MVELTFDRDREFNPSLAIRQTPRGRVIITVINSWEEQDITLEIQELHDLYEWLGKVLQNA